MYLIYHILKLNEPFYKLDNLLLDIRECNMAIFSVRDEASKNLSRAFSNKLDSLYGSTLSDLKYRSSYILILDNKNIVLKINRF